MSKTYISKFARRVIEMKMPASIRKEYKAGKEVSIKVVRSGRQRLFGYGDKIEFSIMKNGELIAHNFDKYSNIIDIIDYMITGSTGYVDIYFNGQQAKSKGEFNHSWPLCKQEGRRKAGKIHHKVVMEYEKKTGRKWPY